MRTVGELVLEETALVPVFEKHGIDYCCGGSLTLKSACESKGLDYDAVRDEVEAVRFSRPYSAVHPDIWDVDFLIDFIVQNHHRYVTETLPVLRSQLKKLRAEHAVKFTYMTPLALLFETAARDLEVHQHKEEMILFPYLKSLASANEIGRARPASPFRSAELPISKMKEEHDSVGQIFARIRALLNNYTVPDGACMTHRALILGLREFERDLHQHIHLENNLLFVRALEMEQKMIAAMAARSDGRTSVAARTQPST
jgi:regulator of cell morphogenesis and NO signaling